MSLPIRLYQKEAADSIFESWKTFQSVLCVMATGLGKTRVASEVVKRIQPKRALFLVDRAELAYQAQEQILKATGLESEIEMASHKVESTLFSNKQVLISTIQTQCAGKNGGRMKKFKPSDFDVLILDEAHGSVAPTWKKTIEHYKQNPNLKILGLTATPDRADETAMGIVFEHVAYEFEILRGIEEGWLVPIVPNVKHLLELDYSHVRTSAGDLNGADLAAVMEQEKIVQGIVDESVRVIGDKKAIAFMHSVEQADMCHKVFNRHREGMATFIHGGTPEFERRKKLKDFTEGRIQVLCNCGIAIQGVDVPDVHYIIMGKPTKSRARFTQMIGRGTRTLPGTLSELYSAYERREAIAASAKPNMVLLEFTGNSGKHKLMSAIDILGGKYPDEVKAKAVKKAQKKDNKKNMAELLKESEEEVLERLEKQRRADEERKKHIKAKATYSTSTVNLFDRHDTTPAHHQRGTFGKQYTENQRKALARNGHDPDSLPYWKGCQILAAAQNARCSPKQSALLIRCGYSASETLSMSCKEASKAIDVLKENNWRRPSKIEMADIPQMATA